MESGEQPRPSQVEVYPLIGRGTLIVRDWNEGAPAACRLCASGCRAFRAADSARLCCVGLAPERVAPEDAALYREQPGTFWLTVPGEHRIRS